ncbi:MAG: class I tRNA ligase family protein, partial [Acidobacteria bacterium]|nr:class I tRNA ligase family protein [Acidobacteriota bacterium]
MIMLTKKFVDKKAFEDVIVTGTVLGKDGKPMSKSRKNGVDPIEMFDKFGVDATRIYLASIATGADIKWNDLLIETYRNFANKIWNATRFCLMNSEGASVRSDTNGGNTSGSECASLADRWIVSRLNKTAVDVNKTLARYVFHTAVSLLYHFFWDDFCDWYIELKKDEINAGDIPSSTRILSILEQALRLLHPFMPYLTEELWQKLPGTSNALHNPAYAKAEATIMLTDFPSGDPALIDEQAEAEMQLVIDAIKRVRNIRSEMNIKPGDRVDIHVAANAEMLSTLAANEAQIKKLARADKLVLGDSLDVPKASAKAVLTGGAELAVPLTGLIDFDKERERLAGQIAKLDTELQRLKGQLSNENFVERAPAEKVQELKDRRTEIEGQIATLKNSLEALA